MADSPAISTAAATPAVETADPTAGSTDTATGTVHTATGSDCPRSAPAPDQFDQLNRDILNALIRLFRQMVAKGETIAERFGVPLFCMKALHIVDASMAMKELGQRMQCDPSFVTAIADALEKRGLARREPNATDRRGKNLVLSAEGLALKQQMERELARWMPWSRVLDSAERESFLALTLKLIDTQPAASADCTSAGSTGRAESTEAAGPADAEASSPATPTGGGRAGEVSDALDTASA